MKFYPNLAGAVIEAKAAMRLESRILFCVLIAAATLAAVPAVAQFGFGGRGRFAVRPNTPYDGRFTFVRVNYTGTWRLLSTLDGPRGRTVIRWPNRI